MKTKLALLLRTVLHSAILFCLAQLTFASEGSTRDPIYFSLIPKKNVDQQIEELQPLIRYLEKEIGRPVRVIRPQSYQTVIDGILSARIDFAILGPASYAKAKLKDKHIEPFASFALQQGAITPRGSFYYSILFSLKDSHHTAISDLKGKKVAFTDPESTSGAIIPNVYFSREIGLALSDYFGAQVYTGSHDRSIEAVKNRLVDAAFVSSARIDEAIQTGLIDKEQVVTLWQSEPIHLDPFVFSGNLDPATKEQIRKLMLSSPAELTPMFTTMKSVGIVAVDDADYENIHTLLSILEAQGKTLQ